MVQSEKKVKKPQPSTMETLTKNVRGFIPEIRMPQLPRVPFLGLSDDKKTKPEDVLMTEEPLDKPLIHTKELGFSTPQMNKHKVGGSYSKKKKRTQKRRKGLKKHRKYRKKNTRKSKK